LVSFQVTRRRRNSSGVSQSPISRAAITWRIQISSCTRNPVEAVRQPGPRSDDRGRSVDNFITDPPLRCRRGLRRLPQGSRGTPELRSLLILLLSARYPRRHRSRLGCRLNAGGAQWAERHGCRESRPPPWMADGGGPTERRRSEGTRRSRAQPGARTLGYLVSFQVTRQRRNRSGVSQSRICRAAIRWRIQISSCTRNPVEAVRQPGPRSDDRGRSVDNFITDPPLRCRRGLRRLPQGSRGTPELRSLLILLLSARYPRRHKSRLGCRLNAGGVEWAERHGCRESRPPPWMADGGGPTERRRSEGTRGTRAQPGASTLGYLGVVRHSDFSK
jgi:hypothetical protein